MDPRDILSYHLRFFVVIAEYNGPWAKGLRQNTSIWCCDDFWLMLTAPHQDLNDGIFSMYGSLLNWLTLKFNSSDILSYHFRFYVIIAKFNWQCALFHESIDSFVRFSILIPALYSYFNHAWESLRHRPHELKFGLIWTRTTFDYLCHSSNEPRWCSSPLSKLAMWCYCYRYSEVLLGRKYFLPQLTETERSMNTGMNIRLHSKSTRIILILICCSNYGKRWNISVLSFI